MLIDARSVAAATEFACDVCVVGAGPAGIAIADRLRESRLSIVLLESGGFEPELRAQGLFRGENHGRPYFRLDGCRFRLFGGGTNRWGGWCRPLDPSDFERRDWIAWSGWPIGSEALERYYLDTARLFELSDARFDLARWSDRLPPPLPLEDTSFENVIVQFSPETNFAAVHGARLLAAPNVTTLLHANLTKLTLHPGSRRIGVLRVAALPGPAFTVRARAVVLAAGAIENARLLLASESDPATSPGNEFGIVGRFFTEHLHVPAGHIVMTAARAYPEFYRRAVYGGAELRGLIAPTASAQRNHRLTTTSIAIEPASYFFGTPFVGWPPPLTFAPIRLYLALRRANLKAVAETFKHNAQRAWHAPLRFRTWNAAREARARAGLRTSEPGLYSLYFRSEQAPEPASRVTLSGRRDALGVPEVRLDWRISPADIDAVVGWLAVLDRDLRARGTGRVVLPADGWQREIIGGPHHMGTTRMSADPRHGVVDEHCRVHSVDNLYVAGASVFATGGYANPTFTLVALALRLADTLRDRLANMSATGLPDG